MTVSATMGDSRKRKAEDNTHEDVRGKPKVGILAASLTSFDSHYLHF